MELAVPPQRTLRWWAIVYAAAVTPVDVERLGLINANGPDLIKWALRAPIWFLPVVLLAPRWGTLLIAFRRPPTSWLLAWATVGMISVAWALAPGQALLIGSAIAGLTLLSTWYVFTSGWHSFATAMTIGLTVFLGFGMLLDFFDSTLVTGRAVGLSSGPTALGRIAAFNIVLAAGIIWSRRSSMIFWVVPMISAAIMLLSETRTAMAAAVVGLLYGGLRRLTPLDRAIVLVGLFVGGLALVGVASGFADVTALGERGGPTSISGRTEIWPVAVRLIAERPILGYGWGASNQLFTQAAQAGSLSFLAGTSHSILLAPLIQGGILGFSLLAAGIVSAFRHRSLVDPWVMAPIVTLLFTGLTEAIVHLPSIATLLLGGTFAAIARTSKWGRSEQNPIGAEGPAYWGGARTGVARGEQKPIHR